MLCLSKGRVTVLVNGKGDGFFKPTRGLHQGCSLSPYLFIITMEFLSKGLGTYTMQSMYPFLNYRRVKLRKCDIIWGLHLLLKVKLFFWLVLQDKISTKLNL